MTDEELLRIERACTRLVNLYAALNDAARWEEAAALYAPDGVLRRPSAPDDPVAGRGAILESFRARPPRATRHVTGGVVIDVEGPDTASGSSTLLLFTAADRPPLVGGFRDRFRLVPGEGWRFAERRGFLDFGPAS